MWFTLSVTDLCNCPCIYTYGMGGGLYMGHVSNDRYVSYGDCLYSLASHLPCTDNGEDI